VVSLNYKNREPKKGGKVELMDLIVNGKTKVNDSTTISKVLREVFETRYTCRVDSQNLSYYWIVTNYNGTYQINTYDKITGKPILHRSIKDYLRIDDVVKDLMMEVEA
jgi:hypothetical protein